MSHDCRAVSEAEAMRGVARYQDMYVPVPDIEQCIRFGEEQHGKVYDFAGAFGLPFLQSDNWADDSRWWCSEHTFALIGSGGLWMLDPAEKKRVTPNDLRQCNYPKSPILKPAAALFSTAGE